MEKKSVRELLIESWGYSQDEKAKLFKAIEASDTAGIMATCKCNHKGFCYSCQILKLRKRYYKLAKKHHDKDSKRYKALMKYQQRQKWLKKSKS